MPVPDSDLIVKFLEGNPDALAELVRRYVDLVFSAAKRQVGGDAHAAEDVVQTVFVRFVGKAATLQGRASLAGWFYTTTHHASANFVRSEQRRKRREAEASVMENIISAAAPEADWSQLQPILDVAMHELGERDRETILMRYFERLPLAEVGERLGVTENAAAKRLERALNLLRKRLAKRGLSSASAALAIVLGEQAVVAAPSALAPTITMSIAAGATIGSGSIALTLLNLMNTAKVVGGIATVVAAIAIGTAVHQSGVLRKTDAALSSLHSERASLLAEREQLRLDVTQLNRAQRFDSAAVAKPAPTPSLENPRQALVDDPTLRPFFLEQAALAVRVQFDPFFKSAGISQEQQDRFVKLSIKPHLMNLELDDALAALGANEPAPGSPAMAQVMEQVKKRAAEMKADATDGMREILGEQAYDAYQKYRSTLAERSTIERLAGQLYQSETPMTAAQGEQLVTLLVQSRINPSEATSPANSIAGTPILPGEFNNYTSRSSPPLGPLISDAAVARAESVLTAEQLSALKRIQSQQLMEIQLLPKVAARAKRKAP